MSAFDSVRAVADAVLLEGYVLYPYRASSTKNRYRWTFGILAPDAWTEAGGCEPSSMRAECLVEGRDATLRGRLRFLQLERRRIQRAQPDGCFIDVDRLEVGDALWLPWDEGILQEIDLDHVDLDGRRHERAFQVPGRGDTELLRDSTGQIAGRIVREREEVQGVVRVTAPPPHGVDGARRVVIEVQNTTPWSELHAPRDRALSGACLSTHLVLSVHDGEFVSLIDPPDPARNEANRCIQKGCFPVLAGDPSRRDLLLVSPIILYDHPQLAPESPGDFHDSSEIDELLALRVSTLTDEEKRQARATDRRSADIVNRVEALPPEGLERLHGAIRELEPVAKRLPAVGAKVRLAPGKRRTDAQDALFAGFVATVEKHVTDVEGDQLLAVTLDEDPAAELHRWYGRFHFYHPDEVEELEEEAGE